MEIVPTIIWVLWLAFLAFQALLGLAAIAAVVQEVKIWAHPKLPSLNAFGILKVFLLNIVWMEVCLFGALVTILKAIVTLDLKMKNTRPMAHGIVENYCGRLLSMLFIGPVEVRGLENLPPADMIPAPVYVANHHSQIDGAVCCSLVRPWRWIAKSSMVFLPGVGQIMYLSDHVFINRVKKKGGDKSKTGARNLYVKSNESIQNGVPMMFFPQGTRRLAERLPFRDGAFKIALENESLVVPFSIYIPRTAWNSSYPFGKVEPVVLTVHKPIESKGKDLEVLKQEAFDAVHSVLPDFSKVS
jgi:lysophosphatidate acyltransferase